MSTPTKAGDPDLTNANPHAVAAIVEASASRSIVASQDIYDERGVKLWAQGQPVSESLQQRLLERKLKVPLEASLEAADGVDGVELKAAAEAFLASDHAVARALAPWGPQVLQEVAKLPVQSVAQLLLTAAQAARPGAFDHAIRGMVLAGSMALHTGADEAALQLALQGGLLHDLGEMYVNPEYLNPAQPLDMAGYKHVAVHPRVGAMLITKHASYPAAVARAIEEHHERLDGGGYPGRLAAAAISPLGRLLAVMEVTLGIAANSKAPWAHTSFALRMVPGEFDGAYTGFVSAVAHQAGEDLAAATAAVPHGLHLVDGRLATALVQAEEAARRATSSSVHAVALRAAHLLFRLRIGWNEMGLWSAPEAEDASPEARFELGLAHRELSYRMRFIRRECLWAEKDLNKSEGGVLAALWACLEATA